MKWKSEFLVLLGAAIGGALGYVLFFWIAGQGFYGLALPGGLLGLGAGVFKCRSKMVAAVQVKDGMILPHHIVVCERIAWIPSIPWRRLTRLLLATFGPKDSFAYAIYVGCG
jgi:hypothetical protein